MPGFHHQCAAGRQQPCGLRNQGAIGVKPVHAAVQCEKRVVFAHLPVKVEAVLGRSRLTIEDANGLAVGDVLILDRVLGEDAELRVQGGGLVAVGQLVADNGHNTIRIASSGKGLN